MLDAKVDSRESTDVQALYEAEVEKGLHAPVTLMTAAQIIQFLDLKPHPEGGHCRETFRDATGIGGRAASTAIYFLLARGERSHWHRIDAAEVWHYYAGAPLTLEIADTDEGPIRRLRLGADFWPASVSRPWFRALLGKPPRASATGRWSVARWRRDSNSPASNWRAAKVARATTYGATQV